MARSSPSTPFALRDALEKGADLDALRQAIAHLPVAVLIADRHGRYVAANAAACRLTGFEANVLTKKALPDLTGFPDAAVEDVLWRAFLDQGHQTGEFTIQRQDGTTLLVSYEALANVIPGYHASFLRPVRQ